MRLSFPNFSKAALCCVFGAALAFAGCSKSPKPDPDVLARVGTREIRTADLKREVERRRKLARSVPAKEVLLREMVQYEALLQRAKASGIDQDPQVEREIGNLLVSKLIDREVTAKAETVTVTEDEIRAEYEKNVAKYTDPAKVRLAVLFLESSASSTEAKRTETRERLVEGLRKFRESPPALSRNPATQGFDSLAVQYSEDQASRYRGGDIGWLNAGDFNSRWPKAVLEAGYKLEKGQTSEIIQTDTGFYAVMKTDARDGMVRSLKEAEPALRYNLLLAKRRQLDENFRKDAERLTGVTLHEKALAAFELPTPEKVLAKSRDAQPPEFPATAPLKGGKR